jgi:Carboxypeptidase regulatory-like domain/TonB dependent receptor
MRYLNKVQRPIGNSLCSIGSHTKQSGIVLRGVVCALLLIGFAILSGTTANAQQVYGTIDGTVTDNTGAVVPGAAITITETTKGVVFTSKTNPSGFYSQGQLIPGTYAVVIEVAGFTKVASTPLTISVDQVTRFDAALAVGSTDQTVQVSSAAPLLETDRVDVATTLTSEQILTLPEYQRNFIALEFLTPGVLVNPSSTPSSENPQGSFRARVNGQMWGTTGYQLDGTDNQDTWLASVIINPDPDSVAESKFSTENFDAENGYVAGGMFVASTKSGSNNLHGSLFEYLINNSPGFKTVGANPFTQPNGAPPLKNNQFGGSIGGHILRNKLFYFGDVQIQRRREGDSLLTTVPTAEVQKTCGMASTVACDLSEYLNTGPYQLYDPTTGNASTGLGRTRFTNNQIPLNRLSTQAQKILAYFPVPTLPGVVNNYIASGSQVFNAQQYNTREDYYLNDKSLFFGRYTFATFSLSVPGAFGYAAGGPGLDSTGYSGISNVDNQSLSLGYTHIFNPQLINELRFGFYRYNVHEVPGGYGTQPATEAGIPGLNLDNTVTSGMPALYIPGASGATMELGYALNVNRCNCTLTETENEFQIVDNFTKVVGNHTFKVGFDLRRTANLRVPSDSHRAGELTFAQGYTGQGSANGATTNGLGLATFLLGQTTTFSRYVSTITDATAYLDRDHFYGQDTWHATHKLTLSYGLRWELTFPESTAPGKGGLLDLNTGKVVINGVGGNSSRNYQQMVYHNFAPRLGIAYQLTPKTVLRAGYGWAYSAGWAGSIFNEANITLPVILAQSSTPSNSSQGVFGLASGPPAAVFPTANGGFISLPNNISDAARPHTLTLPVVYAYNATIQRQLTNSISVSAAYVGNSGRHAPNDTSTNFNANQASFVPGVTNLNTLKPYFASYGWTQSISYFCNCAVNQYNSLQASVDIRNYHGYTAQGTYLYERAYGDGTGGNLSYTMLYNRPLGYGNEANTPNTQVIVVQDYELPYGKGKYFGSHAGAVATALLGGWRVTGITTFLSGQPFTAAIGAYPSGYAAQNVGIAYPDRGTVSPYAGAAHNRQQWYQGCSTSTLSAGTCAAFLLPAANKFGNYGFDDLYGPININQDLAAMKSIKVTEKYNFTLRTDAFNVFNHANLGQPDATITDATAGKVTSLAAGANMRRLQFALRMDF